MIFQDDRTKEQKKTHSTVVSAKDSFMSGWGAAKGGNSHCGWACKPEDADACLAYVQSRSEMENIGVRHGTYWKPARSKHYHIYVFDAETNIVGR